MWNPFCRSNWKWAVLLGGAACLAAFLLYYFPPEKHSLYPRCAFYTFTGLQCPGCGGLRCLHQLLHGNVANAFRYNPLIVSLLPFLVVGAIFYLRQKGLNRPIPELLQRNLWIWCLIGLMFAFAIVRNLPFGPLAHFRP